MITKIMLYAMSVASRGFKNTKTDIPTKQLRYISCYGTGIISPCKFLNKSQNSNYFFCGKCGCGDKPNTWLIKEPGEYCKLDYPTLSCPLKMPGFTNYDPNFYDNEDGDRKKAIEQLPPETVQLVQITVNSNPANEEMFDKINKIIENT